MTLITQVNMVFVKGAAERAFVSNCSTLYYRYVTLLTINVLNDTHRRAFKSRETNITFSCV